jgi:hypothetical protein
MGPRGLTPIDAARKLSIVLFSTYHITLDDGSGFALWAPNAGAALEGARRCCPGNVVTECHAGLTPEEAKRLGGIAGVIRYEIPRHRPFNEMVKRRVRRVITRTPCMFDDTEIKSASSTALKQSIVLRELEESMLHPSYSDRPLS